MRLYANSYHNIHHEPEYIHRQRAEIYEYLNEILESKKPAPFDKTTLKNMRFGRAPQKASAKVKRTIVEAAIIYYLWIGLIVAVLRNYMRRISGKTKIELILFLRTICLWPNHLFTVMK